MSSRGFAGIAHVSLNPEVKVHVVASAPKGIHSNSLYGAVWTCASDSFVLPMYPSDPDTGERNEFWPEASGAVKIEAVNVPFTIGSVTVGTVIDDKYYIASILLQLRKKKRRPRERMRFRQRKSRL